MTPAEMVTEIADFGFSTVASARMYAVLNQALDEITGKRPWSWRETVSTLTFDGTNPNPLTGATRVSHVLAITNPSTGYQLTPISRQTLQKSYPQNLSDTGEPVLYYFDAGVLKVWRIPSVSQTLTCHYLQHQLAVNSSTTEAAVLLPPRFHWIPIFLTLSRLYMRDDDLEMSKWARDEAERLEALLVQESDMRTEFDRPMTVQIIDEVAWEDYN